MAGDWIKIESGLPNKPEVMQLADLMGVDELQVVGHLVLLWSWCDANMSLDCPVVQGTKKGLDRVARRDGFVDAMVTVGWLSVGDDGSIHIPNYDHHLSKSAKTRANEQKKKSKQRHLSLKASPVCPDANGTESGQKGGPEKRREEKRRVVTNVTISTGFDAWYSTYPRKVGREPAMKAYAKAIKEIGGDPEQAVAALMEASKPRLEQLAKRDAAYIPYPATWLNDCGWKDEVSQVAPIARPRNGPPAAGPGQNYDPNYKDFGHDFLTG
jgi:hypothetical protein